MEAFVSVGVATPTGVDGVFGLLSVVVVVVVVDVVVDDDDDDM